MFACKQPVLAATEVSNFQASKMRIHKATPAWGPDSWCCFRNNLRRCARTGNQMLLALEQLQHSAHQMSGSLCVAS
jgi:hypothetical protein